MNTKSNLDWVVEFGDKIESGDLDKSLDVIKTLVEARITETRQAVEIGDFFIGDKIKINERCGTKYLVGEVGTVTGIRRTKITISLDEPKGRFVRTKTNGETYSAEVIVPISIVDKFYN